MNAFGERQLWCEVLRLGLEDAQSPKPGPGEDPRRLRAMARAWLASPDFREVCEFAGVEPGPARAHALKRSR